MENSELLRLANAVAETEQPLDAVKILNEIEPCDREKVLRKAVDIDNNDGRGDGVYLLTVDQSGEIRRDSLSIVVPQGLFGSREIPLFHIDVPSNCK